MDLRYFELHDILCEVSIALEGGHGAAAAALVKRALRWIEADWLATPAEIRVGTPGAPAAPHRFDEDDDD
jgi:hypothetical protein